MAVMKSDVYNEIVNIISNHNGNMKDLEQHLSTNYKIPMRTAASIISINFVRRMKYSHFKILRLASELLRRYQNEVAAGEDIGILLRMASSTGSSPSLISKVVLESTLRTYDDPANDLTSTSSPTNKEELAINRTRHPGEGRNVPSRMMRDTTLIDDGRLAFEIFLCNLHDDQYGPISEIYNRAIGEEYELLLYDSAKKASLSFQSEQDLRLKGYDKTPDLKLNVPIAVDGFVVNWIESKGLFGDVTGHKTYISEQYSSYWNRFGPGLVIYWLGCEDLIFDGTEKRFIVKTNFPEEIVETHPLSIATEAQSLPSTNTTTPS